MPHVHARDMSLKKRVEHELKSLGERRILSTSLLKINLGQREKQYFRIDTY